MTEIIIKIEKSSDGFFWAFSPDEKMITGGGNTIEKCKQDIFDCIETLKEIENPEYLKEYQVIFDVI